MSTRCHGYDVFHMTIIWLGDSVVVMSALIAIMTYLCVMKIWIAVK